MLKALIRATRPKQWYKNTLVFVGIVFSMKLFDLSLLLQVVYVFLIFCALSGSEYLINDILDVENDRKHPVKRKRPLASGELKTAHAIAFSVILPIIALAGAYFINLQFFGICVLFLLWNLAYSFWLKHIILLDAMVISMNFVIRAVAGCLAIAVPISPWIIVCSFLLALLLVFGKRRHELMLLGNDATTYRKTLVTYSFGMLDQMTIIVTSALIVSYSLHTFLTGTLWMMTTIPVVIYGILRYILLLHSEKHGEVEEMVFHDKGMVISILLWIVMSAVILYGIPGI